MPLLIHLFAIGSDNLGVLIHDVATGRTASIDAGEEAPIVAALQETGWKLTDLFITHHHSDHIAALQPLKDRFGARVVAPRADAHRIPSIDVAVREGDEVHVGETAFNILETPGHTSGHIAYYSAGAKVVFTGDTLFSLGCGRLFEGTPEQMWASLSKLARLPDDTLLYCGHEYTLSNARFAMRYDAGNEALQRRLAEVEALRAKGEFTIPSTIGLEKATNPFLRAAEPALAQAVGLAGHPAVEVFAALREAKNKG
jgi:hydroxyacylglutathione hydrolase